jgi:hypothetical protein
MKKNTHEAWLTDASLMEKMEDIVSRRPSWKVVRLR